jgi:hypothetical protein
VNEMIDRTAGVFVKNMQDKIEMLTKAFEQSGGYNNSRLRPEELNCVGPAMAEDDDEVQKLRDLESYPLRVRCGKITRLPEDFEFPNSTVWDCWERWNRGNIERGIPPLRLVRPDEYKFLDAKQKQDMQQRTTGGTGRPEPSKRRASRKVATDLRFLCNYIEEKALESNLDKSDRSTFNLKSMFDAAKFETLVTSKRKDQLSWYTALRLLRKKQL